MDPEQQVDLVAAVRTHTNLLLDDAVALSGFDHDSRCPGWTRAHVLTHLARNADGLARMLRAATESRVDTMYDSQDARDADIELGARRGRDLVLADLARSCAAFDEALGTGVHAHPSAATTTMPRTPDGVEVTVRTIPLLRLRELVHHHVDLDGHLGYADVAPEILALLLRVEVRQLHDRPQVPGFVAVADTGRWPIAGGGPEVKGTDAAMLAWLARQDPSGVAGPDGALPDLPHGSVA